MNTATYAFLGLAAAMLLAGLAFPRVHEHRRVHRTVEKIRTDMAAHPELWRSASRPHAAPGTPGPGTAWASFSPAGPGESPNTPAPPGPHHIRMRRGAA